MIFRNNIKKPKRIRDNSTGEEGVEVGTLLLCNDKKMLLLIKY